MLLATAKFMVLVACWCIGCVIGERLRALTVIRVDEPSEERTTAP